MQGFKMKQGKGSKSAKKVAHMSRKSKPAKCINQRHGKRSDGMSTKVSTSAQT